MCPAALDGCGIPSMPSEDNPDIDDREVPRCAEAGDSTPPLVRWTTAAAGCSRSRSGHGKRSSSFCTAAAHATASPVVWKTAL